MAGFGSLAPSESWQDAEAADTLRLLEQQKVAKERAGEPWYQPAKDFLTMPGRLYRDIAKTMPEATDEQTARWGQLATSPALNRPAHVINTIGGGLVDAIKSGATLPGDVSQGVVPMFEDGRTSPELVKRAFDTASLAGGASVAGTAERAAAPGRLGRDVRILGREVGSGEPFPHQLIDQPPGAERPLWVSYPPGSPGYEGPLSPRFDLGHRPKGAADARVDAELGWHANDAGMTSVRSVLPRPWETGSDRGVTLDTLASDSGKPGAAVSALEHAKPDWHAAMKGELFSDTTKPGTAIAAAEHARPFTMSTEGALESATRNSGTGAQWANELKRYGAKPEEMDWRGLTDFLKKNENVPITKAAVAEHVRNNPFELKTTDYNPMPETWKELTSEQRYKVADKFRELNDSPPRGDELPNWYEKIAIHSNSGNETALDPVFNPPIYGEYQTAGGKNYRERVLSLPDRSEAQLLREEADRRGYTGITARWPDQEFAQRYRDKVITPEKHEGVYRSSHWPDIANPVVHRRSSEHLLPEPMNAEERAVIDARQAAQGQINGMVQKQHMVAREIRELVAPLERQRDFEAHRDVQAGRISHSQYRDIVEAPIEHPELKMLQNRLQEFRAQEDAIRKAMPPEPQPRGSLTLHAHEIQSDLHQAAQKAGYKTADEAPPPPRSWKDFMAEKGFSPEEAAQKWNTRFRPEDVALHNEHLAETEARYQARAQFNQRIQDAPFKDSWHRLALHDLIREAAEKGLDEISWTAGRSQSTNPKNLNIGGGAPNAERAAAYEKAEKGLIKHYDEKMVNAANKIGKAHGVEVQKSNIRDEGPMSGEKALRRMGLQPEDWNNYIGEGNASYARREQLLEDARAKGHEIFRMKLPQSLKDQALKKGFSMFEDAGPAGATVAALEHAGGKDAGRAAAGLDVGTGLAGASGRGAGVAEAEAAAARHAGAIHPLEGLPRGPFPVGGKPFVPGPIASVHDIAKRYMESVGRPYQRQEKYHPIDEGRAREVAQAFEEMPHAPDDPKVKASYAALVKETRDQYRALRESGVKIEPIPPGMADPYAATPRLAAKDVQENNHLWFFPTEQGFGTNPSGIDLSKHPMMQRSGETMNGKPLLNNDLFRIVHDYFGHLKEGHGFRAAGEENAWRTHSLMYSDKARPAMTTETRGQNSWLNYGPHGEANRKASAADTVYAEQKVGLLPDWVTQDAGAKGIKSPKGLDWLEAAKGAAYPGAKFGERYPETVPPAQAINEKGRPYLSKATSPEAGKLAKTRLAMKPDIEAGNYTPYFDPAKRGDVDPAHYGEFHDTKTNLMKKQVTREQYDTMAGNPDAVNRLEAAYANGLKQKDTAGNWYFMKQLEDEFIKELGPAEGRKMFKERFADAMAATTGGADPTANLLMAHYGNYLKAKGLPVPEAHQFPYPVGGQYAGTNMDQFRKMIMEGAGIDPLKNEKRYNFSGNFLGRRTPSTIDEQMSGLFKPGMQNPPGGSYGHFEKVLEALAAKHGVDPRYFQEVAWAGHKDMLELARGRSGYKAKPMIAHVNDAIERTHRVTGMPRDEIVRRGLVRAEIPLYSDTRAAAPIAMFGRLAPAEER